MKVQLKDLAPASPKPQFCLYFLEPTTLNLGDWAHHGLESAVPAPSGIPPFPTQLRFLPSWLNHPVPLGKVRVRSPTFRKPFHSQHPCHSGHSGSPTCSQVTCTHCSQRQIALNSDLCDVWSPGLRLGTLRLTTVPSVTICVTLDETFSLPDALHPCLLSGENYNTHCWVAGQIRNEDNAEH